MMSGRSALIGALCGLAIGPGVAAARASEDGRPIWPAYFRDESLTEEESSASGILLVEMERLLHEAPPSKGAKLTIRMGAGGQARSVAPNLILDFVPAAASPTGDGSPWRVRARRWTASDAVAAFDRAFPKGAVRRAAKRWPLYKPWGRQAAVASSGVLARVAVRTYEVDETRCPAIPEAVKGFERLMGMPFEVYTPGPSDGLVLHWPTITIESSGHFGGKPSGYEAQTTSVVLGPTGGPAAKWAHDTVEALTPCLGMPSDDL